MNSKQLKILLHSLTIFILWSEVLLAQRYTRTYADYRYSFDTKTGMNRNDTLSDGIYNYKYPEDTSITLFKIFVSNKLMYFINDTSFIGKTPQRIYWPNGRKKFEFFVNANNYVHGPFKYFDSTGNILCTGAYWMDSLWTFKKDSFDFFNLQFSTYKAGKWLYYNDESYGLYREFESYYNTTGVKYTEFYKGVRIIKYPNGNLQRIIIFREDDSSDIYCFDINGLLIKKIENIKGFSSRQFLIW